MNEAEDREGAGTTGQIDTSRDRYLSSYLCRYSSKYIPGWARLHRCYTERWDVEEASRKKMRRDPFYLSSQAFKLWGSLAPSLSTEARILAVE